MQCNVIKMKYTVEVNSKLPRNVAKGLGKPVKNSVKHFIKMFDDV